MIEGSVEVLSQSLTLTTDANSDIFDLRVWQVQARGLARGSVRARMEQDDPVQWFTTAVAELGVDFEVHHPVAPGPRPSGAISRAGPRRCRRTR